jgi:flagellar biosynthetic protein FliP
VVISSLLLLFPPGSHAQEVPGNVPGGNTPGNPGSLTPDAGDSGAAIAQPPIQSAMSQLPDLRAPQNFSAAMQILILLTVLSLAPAILIMMTSFTRIVIVLSLLRQALGTQQLPPNQILVGLSMFMTFLVMSPTLQRVNSEALQPYMQGTLTQQDALGVAQRPLREFMIAQIVSRENDADVLLFTDFAGQAVNTWEDVGTLQLIPGFILSELKTAFLMGFTIYLPFLIVDMVISSILISMGMMMLPPVLISLPFKMLLFVLVDGWRLITGNLMGSFA